jgi:hypothetical protein
MWRNETILEDVKINVKFKLSALWVTLMFFYLYADVLAFYQPGNIEKIIAGEIGGIQINLAFSLSSAMLMAIPSVMVFLSLALKAKVNRWTNIIVGIFHAGLLLMAVLVPGGLYYIFYVIVEAVLIALIVGYAWKWPKQEG